MKMSKEDVLEGLVFHNPRLFTAHGIYLYCASTNIVACFFFQEMFIKIHK